MKLIKLLFTTENNCVTLNTGLLFMRLFVGIFMLTHGFDKLMNYAQLSQSFPDIIGLGSKAALNLIIFAEFGCSILLILGLFTRLATVPLIIGMSVAAFAAQAGQSFAAKELAIVYFCIYIGLMILGPGKFSLDGCISNWLDKSQNKV